MTDTVHEAPPVLLGTLTNALDGISNTLQKIHKNQVTQMQRATDVARDYTLHGSAVIPVGLTQVSFSLEPAIGNAGPEQGRVWVLRRVAVGAPLVTTAAPTITAAFLFQSPVDPLYSGALDLGHLVDSYGTATPVVHFYSARQAVLRNPDTLWVVITGATAGQQFVAGAQVEDYADGGYPARIEL